MVKHANANPSCVVELCIMPERLFRVLHMFHLQEGLLECVPWQAIDFLHGVHPQD